MIAQAIGAGLQLANMGMSWQAQKAAEAKAAQLDAQPLEKYTPDSRLNSFYQQAVAGVANPQGYTGAEIAGYKSRLAELINSRNYNANKIGGGGIGGAIGAMSNAESINALNQFSGNDAALRRSAFNAAMGRQQSAMNEYNRLGIMNTQTALQRRLMKEQGLGQAIQSNKAMIGNSLNNIGGDLMGYGMTKDLMADRLKLAGAGAGNAGSTYSPDLYSTYLGTGSKMKLGNRFGNYANNAADNSGQPLTSQGAITNNQTFSLGNRNPAFSSAFGNPLPYSSNIPARSFNPAVYPQVESYYNQQDNGEVNTIGRNYRRNFYNAE